MRYRLSRSPWKLLPAFLFALTGGCDPQEQRVVVDAGREGGGAAEDSGSPDQTDSDAGETIDGGGADDGGERDGGERDGGERDASGVDAGPMCSVDDHEGCGSASVECTDSDASQCDAGTQVCDTTAGECVECSSSDDSVCQADDQVCDAGTHTCVVCTPIEDDACTQAGLSCDPTTNTCVDSLAPWAADCGNIPAGTDCQGGPVEVLMTIHANGLVALFDPQDGHFLGYWKPGDLSPTTTQNGYFHATQGPDMCIWTSRDNDTASLDRGVERWNTDGSYRDEILPRKTYYVNEAGNQRDLIDDVGPLAFTEDSAYVSSIGGYPNARVVRFDLQGNLQEVVLDDGSEVHGLVVLGDGSMVIADRFSNEVARISADGAARDTLWSGVAASQLSYVGGGKVVTSDYSLGRGETAVIDLVSGQRTEFVAQGGVSGNNRGIAALENGRYMLLSSGDVHIGSVRADSMPAGETTPLWDDPAVERANWQHIGRACLPQAVVDAAAIEPPNDTCITGPASAPLLNEDFETGAFSGSGTDRFYGSFADPNDRAVIDTTTGANGSGQSLRIDGGDGFNSGVNLPVTEMQPSYVSYYARVDDTALRYSVIFQGYFVMSGEPSDPAHIGAAFRFDWMRTFGTRIEHPITPNTWHQIEFRSIDWTTRSYDLYVDCKRVANDIPLAYEATGPVERLDFFNRYDGATMWIDELVIK